MAEAISESPTHGITRVEVVSLVLGVIALSSGLVLAALTAAGIVDMGAAQIMLGAAFIVLVVGAFLVERLSGRSLRRILISVSVTALVSAVVLLSINAWIESKKGDVSAISYGLIVTWHSVRAALVWSYPYVIGFFVAWLLFRTRRVLKGKHRTREQPQKPEPKVLIVTPVDNEGVELHQIVRGYVYPPHSSLQVLVYAGDYRWYVQRDVEVDGYIWSVECQFGNEDSKDDSPYKLKAVYGDNLTERRYKILPDGLIESNVVKVHRAAATKARVVIVTPHHNDAVGWRHMVQGSVTPPDTPVQVLVSGNGPWRPQGKVNVSGSVWSVECTFGDKDKLLDCFNLIALIGRELTEKTYEVPPTDLISSDVVSVQRVHLEPNCPDKWVHQLKANDQANISNLVRVVGIQYRPEIVKGEPSYIDFCFVVFNNSLCEIAISDSIKGALQYGNSSKKFDSNPKMETNSAKRCIRDSGSFVIRQWLNSAEAEYFAGSASDDVLFSFDGLEIMFQGTERCPDIKPTQLFTQHYFKKRDGIWLGYQPEFVFTADSERWVEGSKTAKRVASLTAELDELKSMGLTLDPRFLPVEIRVDMQLALGYVEFIFRVFNGTRFTLLSGRSLSGVIHYNQTSLDKPSLLPWEHNTLSGADTLVPLRQSVSSELVSEMNNLLDRGESLAFTFSDLHIGLRFDGVSDAVVLPLPLGVTCRRGIAVGRIQAQTIEVNTAPTGTLY